MKSVPDLQTPWLDSASEGWVVRIKVQPGARKTRITGELGDQLKIAVASPPVDGKANQTLLKWLADRLDLPKTAVTLLSGQTSRDKRIALRRSQRSGQDLTAATIRHRLLVD